MVKLNTILLSDKPRMQELSLIKGLYSKNHSFDRLFDTGFEFQAIPGVHGDPSSGIYNVTKGCSNLSELPPIVLTVGGIKLTLFPEQYILQASISNTQNPSKFWNAVIFPL